MAKADNIQRQVNFKTEKMKPGTIFSFEDFSGIGKYDTVKKSIQRLESGGAIIRLIDGIFMIPQKSKLTGEDMPPSIPKFADCLAKKFKWSIVPSGENCLNYLGLSTQMPTDYEYISDGPYRKYELYSATVKFKHTSNSEIKNMSYKSAVIVQAIKAIGKENINSDLLSKIRKTLSGTEIKKLLAETSGVTNWVHDVILDLSKIEAEKN